MKIKKSSMNINIFINFSLATKMLCVLQKSSAQID